MPWSAFIREKIMYVARNEKQKNYMDFCIPKIWQILKRFSRAKLSINLLFLKSVWANFMNISNLFPSTNFKYFRFGNVMAMGANNNCKIWHFNFIHMFGQTTRKLVKIALLILYQTNLRTQKSNDKHPIYRLRLPQKYEFAFSLI